MHDRYGPARMNVLFHQLSLAGLLVYSPGALFERLARDPWYWGGIVDWVDGLRFSPGARVLELGCGPGGLALELARRQYAVTAVDRSSRMLARLVRAAEREGTHAEVHMGDACDTGLPGGTFDVVLGASILNVVASPTALVAESLRLVRPGGTISFYLPNPSLDRPNALRFIRDKPLSTASAAILLTWAARARKLEAPAVDAWFQAAGVQQTRIRTHLGGMLSSFTGQRAGDLPFQESIEC